MLCLHCNLYNANRPRGLCWRCYYTPGVKDRFAMLDAKCVRGLAENGRIPRMPRRPTDARPGTAEKLAVMRKRLSEGESLFHPDDA